MSFSKQVESLLPKNFFFFFNLPLSQQLWFKILHTENRKIHWELWYKIEYKKDLEVLKCVGLVKFDCLNAADVILSLANML